MSPALLVACAALLWGLDVLLRPQALSAGWSPARLVLGEHVLLTLAFAGSLWHGRQTLLSLSRPQWGVLLALAWGGSALATWLYTQAFTLGSPLTAVLLQKTQPVFALLLAGVVLGERRGPTFWVWCALALTGAGLVTGITTLPSVHDVQAQQAACALGAAALWGAATVAGRALSPVLPPQLLTGARFALAVPALALLTLVPARPYPVTHSPAHAAVFLALVVLVPGLLGMSLYYKGLQNTPASVATLAELCYPLSSLVLGVLVLHTPITAWQMAGLGLLLVSVVRLSRRADVSAPAVLQTT